MEKPIPKIAIILGLIMLDLCKRNDSGWETNPIHKLDLNNLKIYWWLLFVI